MRAQTEIDKEGIAAAARGEGPILEPEDFKDMRDKLTGHLSTTPSPDRIPDLTTAGTPLGEYMSAITRGDADGAFAH